MKKTISLILMLTMILSIEMLGLVGCKPNHDNGDNQSITVWWPGGSAATEAAIKSAKEQYEKDHPGVTINIEFQSTADFYTSYTM